MKELFLSTQTPYQKAGEGLNTLSKGKVEILILIFRKSKKASKVTVI